MLKKRCVKMSELYNEEYYERGVENKLSGYQNYRWLPHYVMPMANELKKRYGKNSFLDFGAAKGFLVKALRLLDCEAFGYDISEYAVEHSDPLVKQHMSTKLDAFYGVIIAKDVLEHVPYETIHATLEELRDHCYNLVVVVPLGENNVYRIREYELDKTHIIREDEEWWIKQFKEAGFKVNEFYYELPGFKDNWTKTHPFGNAIFFLEVD